MSRQVSPTIGRPLRNSEGRPPNVASSKPLAHYGLWIMLLIAVLSFIHAGTAVLGDEERKLPGVWLVI